MQTRKTRKRKKNKIYQPDRIRRNEKADEIALAIRKWFTEP